MNTSINSFLTDDHHHLDDLLEGFQESKANEPTRAREFLAKFVSALHRHLRWEEEVLFPLFEEKTGQSGLTRTLLGEHEEIRQWLKALTEKIDQNETDSGNEETMLVEELGGHNAREEYALYPELDKLLSAEERDRVLERMAALTKEA